MIRKTAAARLIGSYNELHTDAGGKNGVVTLIRHACTTAQIEDATVPPSSGVRWNAVLRSWSTKITRDLERNNPQQANMEASIVTVFDSLGDQVSAFDHCIGILEATVRRQTKTKLLLCSNLITMV